jgi:hypothetical protein
MELLHSSQLPIDSSLMFALHLPANDLQQHWKRCNLLANYLAEYVAYQYSEREWAENLISTVTNELLEAISLLAPADTAVSLQCRHQQYTLLLELQHAIRHEIVPEYHAVLSELSQGISDSTYIQQLTSERPSPSFNQLGLLMVAHDYAVRITGRIQDATATLQISIPLHSPHI